MYGKHFASMYEGSMVGAGAVVFAVWGYCISKGDPDTHTILLNPSLLGPILGEPVESITKAIDFLTSPDPNSKNPAHNGRRLLHESGYLYFMVSHEDYRNMKTMDDVREYERQRKQKYRESLKKKIVPDSPGPTGTPASVYVSDSVSGKEESEKGTKTAHLPPEPVSPTWRESFEVYLAECKAAYLKLMDDAAYIAQQERFNPNVDIRLTLDKAFTNFWGTEAGWKHKKKSRSKELDWKATFTKAIDLNRVWKPRLSPEQQRKKAVTASAISNNDDLKEFLKHN
jgi:hypothetical protein